MKSFEKCRSIAVTFAVLASIGLTPGIAHAQQPMLGEIRFVGFGFAPLGWANCNGQLMSVAQNPDLYSLLGTKFGGNGVTTFALPDLRGRSPVDDGQGLGLSNRVLGESGGAESHALTLNEMPLHSHVVLDHTHAIDPLAVDLKASSAPATSTTAAGNVLATATLLGGGGNKVTNIYNAGPANVSMAATAATVTAATAFAGGTTTEVGNGKGYPIIPPYLTVKCIIAIQGVLPTP
jgi:microcystin-dependent protein